MRPVPALRPPGHRAQKRTEAGTGSGGSLSSQSPSPGSGDFVPLRGIPWERRSWAYAGRAELKPRWYSSSERIALSVALTVSTRIAAATLRLSASAFSSCQSVSLTV